MRAQHVVRRLLTCVTTGVVVLGVVATGLAGPTAAATTSPGATSTPSVTATTPPSPRVVTTFATGKDGAFAESMVRGPDGALYVSVTTWNATGWNTGQIWRVTTNGTKRPFGPRLPVGVLTGLAFDAHGRLYVGYATWQDPALKTIGAPGVFRVDARSATRVLTLPTGTPDPSARTAAFPNGLAFDGDVLYVSDSTGRIWRTTPHGNRVDTPRSPWLSSTLLAVDANNPLAAGIGVNGIAVRGRTLYAVVASTGNLLRIPIDRHGHPGRITSIARGAILQHADGIAFDRYGTLWVVTNHTASPTASGKGGGGLVAVRAQGNVTALAQNPAWLDYPTQAVPVVDRHGLTLYISNGDFESVAAPNVVAVRAGLNPLSILGAGPAS